MKRAVTGLIILLCFASASSLSALGCYTCANTGFVCGTLGCLYTYECRSTESFCSNCWENCYESPEGACSTSHSCQWAAVSDEEDLMTAETLPLLAYPAP